MYMKVFVDRVHLCQSVSSAKGDWGCWQEKGEEEKLFFYSESFSDSNGDKADKKWVFFLQSFLVIGEQSSCHQLEGNLK